MKKIRWSQVLVALVALTFAYAPASDAGVMTYLNQAAWAAASGAPSPVLAGGATVPGVTVASSFPGFNITGTTIDDQINTGVGPGYTEWTFATPIFGFGASWNLAGPGGPGVGIIVTLLFTSGPNEALGMQIPNSLLNEFFGWTSTTGVVGFRLSEGTQASGVETYSMTNAASTDAVPEPATLFLLGAGLFGTGAAARRRRRNQ